MTKQTDTYRVDICEYDSVQGELSLVEYFMYDNGNESYPGNPFFVTSPVSWGTLVLGVL